MVLTEADLDNPPVSSPDPYSPDTPPYHVDISRLPRPFLGYRKKRTAQFISERISSTSAILHRPLTPEEIDALSFYTAKGISIASYGRPIGISAGLWQAYNTRATFRFPFLTPKSVTAEDGWFDPTKFKLFGIKQLPEQQARYAWHFLRGNAYAFVGMLLGMGMVGSYAATVAAVGELRDPRLKEVAMAIGAGDKEKFAKRLEKARERAEKRDPTGQGQTSASDLWKGHRRRIGGSEVESDADDASPTVGGMDWGAETQGTGIMSDAAMIATERQQSDERKPNTFSMEKASRQPKTFDDDYDAIPASPSPSTPSPTSSWERIRQQTGSPTSTMGQRRRPGRREDDAAKEDSFSFDSKEEEEQLAKNTGQREFDERVDRERRGGDFGAGRPGGRW